MSSKEYLFTPGPTWVPERIFRAMARPTMHHRTKEFELEFAAALEGLRWIVGAKELPILLASSGSGAMEAALLNLCAAGEKIIVVNGGVFGERWTKIGQKLGLRCEEIKVEAGKTVDIAQLEQTLQAHGDARAFCIQYTETSTTVLHPVAEILSAVRRIAPQMYFVADAISALLTLPISFQDLDLDVVVGGSQKGFMLPPGLSMLFLSARAWQRAEANKARSLYFDLIAERKAHANNTSAWTPAMNLILGLNEAIRMIKEEGLAQVYARHALLARATRAGLAASGFTLLAPQNPAPGVTGAYPPEVIDPEGLRKTLLTQSGVRIAGGQGTLQGKIIRIGHMGHINHFDIITALSAIELALHKTPAAISGSAGIRAALEVIKNG